MKRKAARFFLDQRAMDALLESYVRLLAIRNPEDDELQGYRIVDMNNQAARVSGRLPSDVIGEGLCEAFALDKDCWRKLYERLENLEGPTTLNVHVEHLDRYFLVSPLLISSEEVVLFFAEITRRKKAEDKMRIHEFLFDHAEDIILYVDMYGRVVTANRRASESYLYTKEQLKTLSILDLRDPSTQDAFEEQMRKADEEGIVFECLHVRSDGSTFPVEVSAKSTETERGKIRIHIIRDITERKKQEEKIAWLARYDGLTGILNRASFIAELEQELHRARRQQSQFAVLLFDIDKFKLINDSFSHAAGDLVLEQVATRVKSVLRQYDRIGRLGGDEFVVLQTGIEKPEDILSLVQRIRQELSKPVRFKETEIALSISIGISTFLGDATSTNDLLHFADQAMYNTKRQGGNGYSLHQSSHEVIF